MPTKKFWDNKSLQKDLEWGNINGHIPADKFHDRYYQQGLATSTRNREKYNVGKWVLRSPGSDLLDYYDKQNAMLPHDSKAYCKVPPSVVYHYRYEHKYPSKIFDKSYNYGRSAYLRDTLKKYYDSSVLDKHMPCGRVKRDNTYWGMIYTRTFRWLTTEKHTAHEFDIQSDMNEFLLKQMDQKSRNISQTIFHMANVDNARYMTQCYWRGKLAGWSVEFIPN